MDGLPDLVSGDIWDGSGTSWFEVYLADGVGGLFHWDRFACADEAFACEFPVVGDLDSDQRQDVVLGGSTLKVFAFHNEGRPKAALAAPDGTDFGAWPVGERSDLLGVLVFNDGERPFDVTSAAITGARAADFRIVDLTARACRSAVVSCGARSRRLPSGRGRQSQRGPHGPAHRTRQRPLAPAQRRGHQRRERGATSRHAAAARRGGAQGADGEAAARRPARAASDQGGASAIRSRRSRPPRVPAESKARVADDHHQAQDGPSARRGDPPDRARACRHTGRPAASRRAQSARGKGRQLFAPGPARSGRP